MSEKTKYSIVTENLANYSADALITFIPDKSIAKAKGKLTQTYLSALPRKNILFLENALKDLKPCDTFTSGAYMMNYETVINCIEPNNLSDYKTLFYNMGLVIKRYQQLYKLTNIAIYFNNLSEFVLNDFIEEVEKLQLKRVSIFASSPKEYKALKDYLFIKRKNKLFNNLLDKILFRLGNLKFSRNND